MKRPPELFVPRKLVETAEQWETPEGPEWLRALPSRLRRLADRWDLDVGRAFDPGGVCAYVAPARRGDGTDVVLKVTIPHREATHEGAGLRFWNGDGAVRLLDDEPGEGALLLERCRPGTSLAELGDEEEILDVGADLLSRLHRPPPAPDAPFETLGEIATWFSELIRQRQPALGRPVPQTLVDEALEILEQLPASAPRGAVLHHDFHPGNVLSAEREPWLAIDPKPQVGDPAFDPIQLILQTGAPLKAPRPEAVIGARLRRVSERVGVEPERVRLWGVARCVEWALWSFDRGHRDWGEENLEYSRLFSEIGPDG